MKVTVVLLPMALLFINIGVCEGQQQSSPSVEQSATDSSATESLEKTPSIQDNSFLIEEAYNQEKGVVQHINTFMRQRSGGWVYTFTQEWPVGSQRHQLSFTVPVLGLKTISDSHKGFGDVALNYRYQLIGSGDSVLAIAPRISLLAPSGDAKHGLGAGRLGIQANLPVSIQLSDHFVIHSNGGMTLTPGIKRADGTRTTLRDYNLGQSLVWLAKPNFNVMLEALWTSQESVGEVAGKKREVSFIINPGVRWAHNFSSGLQVVPGISIPVSLGSNSASPGLCVYLSVEHPFKR